MHRLGHFIDGKLVTTGTGRTVPVYDPAKGEVQSELELADTALLQRAIASGLEAQPKWAMVNPQRRARVFMRFAALISAENPRASLHYSWPGTADRLLRLCLPHRGSPTPCRMREPS